MNPQLKLLVELQTIDSLIDKAIEEKAAIPGRIMEQQKLLEEAKLITEEIVKQVKEMKVKLKENELELNSNEEETKKHQAELYAVKSNEAYQKLLEEIKGLKTKKDEIENTMLDLMEKIEDSEKKVKIQDALYKQREKEINQEFERLKGEEKQLENQIDQGRIRREETVGKIASHLVEMYEKIRTIKGGLALAEVRHNVCEGCHIQLTPQLVNEIQGGDKLVTCATCSRILYLPGE